MSGWHAQWSLSSRWFSLRLLDRLSRPSTWLWTHVRMRSSFCATPWRVGISADQAYPPLLRQRHVLEVGWRSQVSGSLEVYRHSLSQDSWVHRGWSCCDGMSGHTESGGLGYQGSQWCFVCKIRATGVGNSQSRCFEMTHDICIVTCINKATRKPKILGWIICSLNITASLVILY